MPNPSISPPVRPGDVAGASLRQLLDAYHAHFSPLVSARHGIGMREPVARLCADALDVLACGQALADRILAMRWVTVAEALGYGAPLAHVAAAMGLEPDEVAAGLRAWAHGQHQRGGITAAGRDEVYALVADVEVAR